MCYDINHMFMNVTMSGSSNIAKFQLENLHKLILYINNLQKISCEPTLNISNCDCNEKLSNLTIPSQKLVFSNIRWWRTTHIIFVYLDCILHKLVVVWFTM